MSKRFKISPILKKLTQNQLVAGGLVMFIGTMIANLGNYFYHLLMGRMLGPRDYGVLESVISVAYLLFILINALTLTTAKFVANLKGKKDFAGIHWFWQYFTRKVFLFSSLICLLIVFSSPLITSFLHLNSGMAIALIGFLFLISSVSAINRSTLQGLLNFKQLVTSHIGETATKLGAAIVLVLLGLGVNGAVLALVIGAFVGYFFAFIFLKPLKEFFPRKPDVNRGRFIKFALPVLFFNLSFTSLYTNDVILVKHYFSSFEAGLYAAVAIFGKIIFFATSAIPMVMFPMVANRHSQGKDSRHLLLSALLIVLLISLGAIGVYWLFPQLMITVLFGKEYLKGASLLVWMAVFISLYSLSYLLTNYFLSADKVRPVVFSVLAALSQIGLIAFFHQTLLKVIQVSTLLSGLLFLSLMLYFVYDQKKASLGNRSGL